MSQENLDRVRQIHWDHPSDLLEHRTNAAQESHRSTQSHLNMTCLQGWVTAANPWTSLDTLTRLVDGSGDIWLRLEDELRQLHEEEEEVAEDGDLAFVGPCRHLFKMVFKGESSGGVSRNARA